MNTTKLIKAVHVIWYYNDGSPARSQFVVMFDTIADIYNALGHISTKNVFSKGNTE